MFNMDVYVKKIAIYSYFVVELVKIEPKDFPLETSVILRILIGQ